MQVEDSLFDRESELLRLRAALSGNGDALCYLLSGDPGIGKTHLLRQVCKDASDGGAVVLSARCPEQAGAPPWWPWTQILRSIISSGIDAGDLDALRPIIAGPVDVEQQHELSIPQQNSSLRFRRFDAVVQLCRQLGADQLVVIAIDDIHWADELSLRLLEHLVSQPDLSSVLLIATFRDAELSRHRPLGRSLSRITANHFVQRLRLGGLSRDGTAQLMASLAGTHLSHNLVKAIHHQADGNPFFVAEITHYLLDAGYFGSAAATLPTAIRIPEGIRDVVSERLNHLGEHCRELLEAAAVLGRTFNQRILMAMTDSTKLDRLLEALDEAVTAHLVNEVVAGSGTFEFCHALVGEAIYDELSRTQRMRLHARAARALEHQRGSSESSLEALANHWLQSAAPGAAENAASCFIQAADRAAAMLAYEDACGFLQQTIECLEAQDETTTVRIGELYLKLGDQRRRAGRTESSQSAFNQAIEVAETLDDPKLYAHAALGYENARWRAGLPAHVSLARLEIALDRVADSPSALRVKLLASVARARSYSLDEDGINELAEEAIALARKLRDPTLLCDALGDVYFALRRDPVNAATRLQFCIEHVERAKQLRDDTRVAHGSEMLRVELLESGQLSDFDKVMAASEIVCHRLREPHHLYQIAFLQVMRALLEGRYGEVAELAGRARSIGECIEGSDSAGVHAMQMFMLFRDTGQLCRVAPILERLVDADTESFWGPGLALLWLELGQHEKARQQFDRLAARNFAAVAMDELWLTSLVFASEVCKQLKDSRRAETLYRYLQPHEGRLVITGPGVVCHGPVDRYLGLLAATTGQPDAATVHLENAIELAQSIDALPWVARACYDVVSVGGCSNERSLRTDNPLATALDIAGQLGMLTLLEQCKSLGGGKKIGMGIEPLTKRELDVLGLLAEGISNKGIADVLSISRATVATHVRNVLAKTGANNRTEAAALALRERLGI